ncbi:MAG: SsrA-binding protein SmpB [Desulfovibrio sp.]|jgi:SsrA-binding protein|nr:SsrA-binding protein SmpB [Desulfovibrio sp.]
MHDERRPPILRNKKARHNFEFLDFTEAGIVLNGAEIKSLRKGDANFHDAHVLFRQGEAFLTGLHIAPYANAGYTPQEPDRDRKLLLHAREIRTLAAKVEQKGLALIPVNLHFSRGKIKVELALARGRKLHDQRQNLKETAALRDAGREMKLP